MGTLMAEDPGVEEAFAILKALSPRHRAFLVSEYSGRIGGLPNREERLFALARILGVAGVEAYRRLYEEQTQHSFAWYVANRDEVGDRVPTTVAGFTNRVRRGAPYLIGKPPAPILNQPPILYSIDHETASFAKLRYVSYVGDRMVADGYSERKVRDYRFFEVVLRLAPLTLEMRRVSLTLRGEVRTAACASLGLKDGAFTACRFEDPGKQIQLERTMAAREFGVKGKGRDKHLGPYSLFTDGAIKLDDQEDFQKIKGDAHRDPTSRVWLFWTTHTDGYTEEAAYYINVRNGDVSLSGGISETAIESFRVKAVGCF
jgi:hypothetical protein